MSTGKQIGWLILGLVVLGASIAAGYLYFEHNYRGRVDITAQADDRVTWIDTSRSFVW